MKFGCFFRGLLLLVFLSIVFILPSAGQNNQQLLIKPNLRVLDLGNSYTNDVTINLPSLVNTLNVDISDMCLYKAILPNSRYGDWYKLLTGDYSTQTVQYQIAKVTGGLTADTETGDFDCENNAPILHLLTSNEWDLIIIHQQSAIAPYYEIWNENNMDGMLNELMDLLHELQPQASFGTYLIHSYSDDYKSNKEKSTFLRWQLIANSVMMMTEDYDIDFVLPYGTAIENLRRSSLNNETDLTRDGSHLALGLSRYTGACCYYEALLAPRTHVSMMGNNYRISFEETSTTFIPVTDENAPIAQEAVMLAMEDWYRCVNPEDTTDVADKYILFADPKAKSLCLSHWDRNGDGQFSENEAARVEDIGTVFQGEKDLKSFEELSYFTRLKEIPSSAFEGCNVLSSIDLPKNVKRIGESAFRWCNKLTKITFPENLVEIGNSAFYSCSALKQLNLPDQLERIGEKSFYDCNSMKEIILPGSVTFIGSDAFCITKLRRVYNKSANPIFITNDTFHETVYPDGYLIVPIGSSESYKESSGWKLFGTITEAEIDSMAYADEDDIPPIGNIYTVSGMLVRRNAESTDGLKPGVYIINRRKVVK
jgi:hypothetical protein